MKKFWTMICAICIAAAGVLGAVKVPGGQVYALDEETAAWVEEARSALGEIVSEKTVMALVYLNDEYPIRTEADYDSAVVRTVPSGQQVQIQDVFVDDDYEVWSYVTFYCGGQQYWGYIPRIYLACSDQAFLEWEDNYGMNPASRQTYAVGENGERAYADIEAFPESYREALLALKEAHPNWTFVKMNTGLDWDDVIANEMKGGKSLVPDSYPDYMKEGPYGAGWSYAAENILEYYIDPRNSLKEETIFQFELLTYNPDYHTEAAVQQILDGTFMSGIGPGTVLTYAKIFWANGAEMGVSPFHLACRVYQEQGKGTSPLISGTYPGFEGYYNYFNVKASGKTNEEIIVNGLTYAKEKGWSDAYYSIRGGAQVISANYILKGQDTLYLQKFNVDPNSPYGPYGHQYMQNIVAPTSEGKNIRKSYINAGSLDNTFVFKIPVFENMPETACPYPEASTDVVLTPPAGYTDATIYLDGVAYPTTVRNGKYVVTAPNSEANTATMYEYNEKGVPVGMYCWNLSYSKGAYTATALPGLEDLLTYHGFSIRITGESGIRFKTGISTATRANLLGNGVDGYRLKEYGTLVMKNVNYGLYPLIKGGTKTISGKAYGYNENGSLQDAIFETTGGRYRYTSVLIGLPAKEYQQEYAFRGYAILTKDGKDTIFYGPVVAKSIYELAEVVLANGTYEAGSAADQFLRQLIADADALAQEAGNSETEPGGGAGVGDVSGGDVSGGDAKPGE